ncbi:MAG: beta-mannosidase [bacterium]
MQVISLDGRWEFRSELDSEWLTATVPGDVHLDLLRNGKIDDPLYGTNAEKCKWIEERLWYYRKIFNVSKDFIQKKVELVFDGLDLDAEIFLNGVRIGEHHNAFIPYVIDVTSSIREGENELLVYLDVGKKRAKGKPLEKYGVDESYYRIWMRKPQFVFGWDWGPYLPTCGIWRGVQLRSYESVAIRDVFLKSSVLEDKAKVEIELEIENFESNQIDLDISLSLSDERTFGLKERLSVKPGLNVKTYTLEIDNPRLWYPAPIGEPFLYDFKLEVSQNNKLLDNYSAKYGIREVKLIQEPIPEGTSFIISINGKKVFCKGADWIPADSIIANVSKEKYKKLIELAKEANFNMFRIWGGGIYEDPYFYELCDKNGIMIWQDFMFACAPYPDDDKEFMQEVEKEARTVIKQLRNHPSLVVWCGNNENQWIHYMGAWGGKDTRLYGSKIYDELLPEICKKLDPTRPYWPSSPYGGEDPNSEECGDRHAWTLSIQTEDPFERVNYKLYALDKGKFITEFGQLAPPLKKSLIEFTPDNELYIDSPTWRFHNNTFERGNIKASLERFFIPQEKLSLDEYLLSAQMIQAEALKFALEHWKRRMFNTAGELFWMYSDCWGTTGAWTVVDYYLRLKPSYYFVKRVFEPIHISIKEQDIVEIVAVNETYKSQEVEVEYGIEDFNGRILERKSERVELPGAKSLSIGKLDVSGIKEKDYVFVYAKVSSLEGGLISKNRIFLVDFKDLKLPEAKIDIKLNKIDVERYELSLTSDRFVWMVSIDVPDGISLSDNYFDIFPGEEIKLSVKALEEVDLYDIKVYTLNDIRRRYY